MNATQAAFLSNSTDGFSAPEWWKTFDLVHATILGILVAIAIVGNTLTIAAVVKFRHLREHHYMLIVSLAVADALVGVAWGIYTVTVFYPLWCFIALDAMIITFPTAVSHLHVLLMAVDRFFAIRFPFRYLSWISDRCIKIFIAIVWVVAFAYVLTFLSVTSRDTQNMGCRRDGSMSVYVVSTQFVIYLLVVCSIVMIYTHINRVATEQVNKRNIRTATVADVQQTYTSSDTIEQNTSDGQDRKQPVTPKATKFMIAVIVAYLITWTPYFVSALAGIIKPHLTLTNVVWQVMMRVSVYFMLLNSSLNVFIYAAYISGFRKAYKAMLLCSLK